jgi:hypothetical protein
MLAMLRTAKASPGCRPRVTDGHTRESEQANTMYCMHAAANSWTATSRQQRTINSSDSDTSKREKEKVLLFLKKKTAGLLYRFMFSVSSLNEKKKEAWDRN